MLHVNPEELEKPKRRSSSFLQSMIDQQSYTTTGEVRKPSIDVITRARQERSKIRVRPNTTFLTSEISKSEPSSFKLPKAEPPEISVSTPTSPRIAGSSKKDLVEKVSISAYLFC